jgi:hypothetical protein
MITPSLASEGDSMTAALVHRLDSLVRPSFRLAGSWWPFYGLFVCSGIAAGVVFALVLTLASGVPIRAVAAALGAGLLAAGALALATEVLAGREIYTFYHYQIAALAAGAGALALLDLPVLPCLDVIGTALGLVQACGRLGCFMAGCCHGRPCRWGVRYGTEHAEQGFESELVGVRLFPIQAVESLCLFALAAGGAALIVSGRPAGTALATYLAGYGAIRFGLEFARGDAARPYALGFSEAQWTAGIVLSATLAGEIAGWLPFVPWHAAAAAAVGLAAAGAALRRRFRPAHRLFHPRHVSEIAKALSGLTAWPSPPGHAPRVACTSLGLRLSAGSLHHGRTHYALSAREAAMTEATARSLAALILRLRHPAAPSRLLPGGQGVFHLLVETRS